MSVEECGLFIHESLPIIPRISIHNAGIKDVDFHVDPKTPSCIGRLRCRNGPEMEAELAPGASDSHRSGTIGGALFTKQPVKVKQRESGGVSPAVSRHLEFRILFTRSLLARRLSRRILFFGGFQTQMPPPRS